MFASLRHGYGHRIQQLRKLRRDQTRQRRHDRPQLLELVEEHYECLSDDALPGVSPPITIKENTFFNPHHQTAAIFLQSYAAKIGEVHIENNFLAGGGFTIYGAEEPGTGRESPGKEYVTGNRFARACKGEEGSVAEGGHWPCPGQKEIAGSDGRWTLPGGGYFPRGGSYGYKAYMGKELTWSGNYWDDNLQEAQ